MRKIIAFVLAALCAVMCMVPAFAHPGNTDGDGGHYDRSTGEYHYHHGYPPHQHEDGMCPYNFDDKTGQNSGSGGNGASGGSQKAGKPDTGEDAGMQVLLLVILSPFAVSFGILLVAWIRDLKPRREYRVLYEGKSISELAGVPNNVSFDGDGIPHMRNSRGCDKFTVYATPSGRRYHVRECQNARNGKPVHVCVAKERGLSPCSRCRPISEIPDWLSEYRRIDVIRRRYRIEMLP